MKDYYRLRYYTVNVFEAFAKQYVTLASGIIMSYMLCHALHSKF